MLRAVIVAGGIMLSGAGGAGTAGILADTTTSAPFDWSSLVGGAVGSSPAAVILGWQLNKREKDNVAKDLEIRRLNDRAADQFAPLLERVASVLRDVETGLGATINRARPEDVTRAVSDLRDVVDEMRRGRGQV